MTVAQTAPNGVSTKKALVTSGLKFSRTSLRLSLIIFKVITTANYIVSHAAGASLNVKILS